MYAFLQHTLSIYQTTQQAHCGPNFSSLDRSHTLHYLRYYEQRNHLLRVNPFRPPSDYVPWITSKQFPVKSTDIRHDQIAGDNTIISPVTGWSYGCIIHKRWDYPFCVTHPVSQESRVCSVTLTYSTITLTPLNYAPPFSGFNKLQLQQQMLNNAL
jgi:hypothetical protein